jgi:hypothetical protein
MKTNILKIIITCSILSIKLDVSALIGPKMPGLHIEGRYLKDSHGNTVNLHGFAQAYGPWFNNNL